MKKTQKYKISISVILSLFIFSNLISASGIFIENNHNKLFITNDQRIEFRDILFDLKMQLMIKFARYPSLSACIINEDKVIWSKGYGFYDIDNKKPATENTIYNIASISKTITGTALMQLWEQGLFDLDEDVNSYLPFNLRNPNFPDDPITFRMILSHSSSINSESSLEALQNYLWFNFSADPPFVGYPYPWLEEHLIPGGKWYYPDRWSNIYRPDEYTMYANVNFDIIAYLVELISGDSFIDYCKEHIFIPLEMYNTSFNLSELNIDNVAIPYHYHDGEYLKINELSYMLGEYTPPDIYWRMHMYPAGGLYTTVTDFSHFLIAHMNGGEYNGVRMLEEYTIEEMHRIQPPGNIDPFGKVYHGLAWTIAEKPFIFNLTLSGHGGGTYGVATAMYYIPDENIGLIHFTNMDAYYEKNKIIPLITSQLFIPISLFKKGGYNLLNNLNFDRNQ